MEFKRRTRENLKEYFYKLNQENKKGIVVSAKKTDTNLLQDNKSPELKDTLMENIYADDDIKGDQSLS